MNQGPGNQGPRGQRPGGGPLQGPRSRLPGCGWSSALIWIALALLLAPLAYSLIAGFGSNTVSISYSTFVSQVQSGNVKQVTITGQQVQGQLNQPATQQTGNNQTTQYTDFSTYLPSSPDDQLLSLLESNNVDIKAQPAQGFPWVTVLLNGGSLLVMVVLGYVLFRRMRGQAGGGISSITDIGKSRAHQYGRQEGRTTFDDVAGVENAKHELEEIITFLVHPQRFERLGGEIPKGVLLVGPPGTGKTLLARAVAGEAGVPFFSISGSDFMEMFVGVGASRVRDLFNEAKKAAPAIVFIDELDSIGRRRGAGIGGGHDEREQTLNQLLSEMDGFEANKGVIMMAATNRPDILDPALLRPGRFDRRITVDLPTMQARKEILEIHARNKPLADEVDLRRVARGTPGFSGADLENLLNEAALLAAGADRNEITSEDIDRARDKVLMGLERANMALTDDERKLLAYHEGGHAVVAAVLPNADPIHKVSIVPRGRSMGVTQQLPERDRYIYPEDYMIDRLAVMMGGRAGEELVLNVKTSGAEDDLKQATRLARKMVLSWGMSEELGPLAFGDDRQNVFLGEEIAQRRDYSEATARRIDEEVRRLLEESYQRATETLESHRDGLDRVAEQLIAHEEIPGEKVVELVRSQGTEREAAPGVKEMGEPSPS
jgi:cell division protease FtsH